MLTASSRSFWCRLAPLLVLPGCLVSFNDYPLEASGTEGGTTGASSGTGGDTSTGNVATGGSASAGKASTGGSSAASGGSAGEGPSGDAGDGPFVDPGEGGSGPTNTEPAPLVDDFEDGNKDILDNEGRVGSWYAGNDGQGQQNPANGMAVIPAALSQPRNGSERALHTWGGPFQSWGALIGTSLAGDGETDGPYDVSGYQGIRFYVRSGSQSPYTTRDLRFNMPTVATNAGGGCSMCNDHFGVDITLSSQWQEVEVRFSQLGQEGWGVPDLNTPNLKQVTAIQFYFVDGVSFDLWVDDIELF